MGSTVRHGFSGASLSDERFTDLNFADNAVIFAETMPELTVFLETLSGESEYLELLISWMKTKIQEFSHTVDQVSSTVSCRFEEVVVVSVFHYLGYLISDYGCLGRDGPSPRSGLGCNVVTGGSNLVLVALIHKDES